MDRIKHWEDSLEQHHGKLRWVTNIEKDDESARMGGHIIGPPRAGDQHSAEELEEMGVVGIYVRESKP